MSLTTRQQQAEELANSMIQGNTETAPEATPEPTHTPEPVAETPQATIEPQTQPQATSDNVDWQAKYQVLQGKYNKEVKAIHDKAALLDPTPTQNEADSALLQEVEQLRQKLAQVQATNEQPTLNEHLVSEYGEEFAKAVAETANAQVAELRNEFDNRFSQQQQDISSWTTESKMTAVKQSLAGLKIDFNLVDNDPLFHDWMKESDPYSGQTRQTMMMSAFNQGELDRVTRFYTAFVEANQVRAEQHPFSQHVEAPPSAAQDIGATQAVFDPDAFQALHRKYQRGGISDAEFAKAEREMYAALSR